MELLDVTDLHPSLVDPVLRSMTFANEVGQRYPDAISFASGRPYEEFFDVEDVHRYLRRFCEHLAERGYDEARVRRTLFQYGRTKGIVHELVARNLELDEGMSVDPESIVVTVGCQEAMFLVARTLRAGPRDVLLAVAPTYFGMAGAARLVELPVLPVGTGPAGVDLADLATQVHTARAQGLRPRACYVMPDFANPSGISLDLPTRHALLDAAAELDILLLEDNPYGLFPAAGVDRLPTLKALDTGRRVVYLGTYSKTVLPGARVGFVVADQRVADGSGGVRLLADQLAQVKSMVSVNTSALAQAVVAGKLLEHGCSLVAASTRERGVYAANVARIVSGLAERLAGVGVSWNVPSGGFFVVVTVPFPVDDAVLERAASRHGVVFTPMHVFYDGTAPVNALRLSGSNLPAPGIDAGLDRLAALVHAELAHPRA